MPDFKDIYTFDHQNLKTFDVISNFHKIMGFATITIVVDADKMGLA